MFYDKKVGPIKMLCRRNVVVVVSGIQKYILMLKKEMRQWEEVSWCVRGCMRECVRGCVKRMYERVR